MGSLRFLEALIFGCLFLGCLFLDACFTLAYFWDNFWGGHILGYMYFGNYLSIASFEIGVPSFLVFFFVFSIVFLKNMQQDILQVLVI